MIAHTREDGFTLTELMISMTIMLIVTGAALTTFRNALNVNDSATQLSDANQNLRAGTNTLVRDLMMAGRIIGPGGIPVPTGAGVGAFNRPSPGAPMTFNLVTSDGTALNLPDIETGYQKGPIIHGSTTDMVTIMTVDEFIPVITTPPPNPSVSPTTEGTIAPDGASVLLPATSLWLVGDTVNDTPAIQVGDLILFKNPNGIAIQTITSKDSTHIYFAANDWFNFNQRNVAYSGTILNLKSVVPTDTTTAFPTTTLFRALMLTYYVDNTTTPGESRLTRVINHFTPMALAGVVEDLDLTYDLVDGSVNPTAQTSLPYTDAQGNVYTSNQIRKVNIHMGVRSEVMSKPTEDYVRNHISTAVDVRSLASVDRYVSQ